MSRVQSKSMFLGMLKSYLCHPFDKMAANQRHSVCLLSHVRVVTGVLFPLSLSPLHTFLCPILVAGGKSNVRSKHMKWMNMKTQRLVRWQLSCDPWLLCGFGRLVNP